MYAASLHACEYTNEPDLKRQSKSANHLQIVIELELLQFSGKNCVNFSLRYDENKKETICNNLLFF